jgi:alanyl-tRNA synthetase
MTETELQQVEDFVNARIRTITTYRRRDSYSAKLIEEGAMALFGEIWRYGACDLAKAWNFVESM